MKIDEFTDDSEIDDTENGIPFRPKKADNPETEIVSLPKAKKKNRIKELAKKILGVEK